MKKSVFTIILAIMAIALVLPVNLVAQHKVKAPSNLSGKAREYYVAAVKGDEFSQVSLAVCYQNGDGAPVDYEQAIYWYQKASEKDNVVAQYNLGCIYDEGVGVPRNYELAAFWYQKAAMRDDALAQCSLANCYYNGEERLQKGRLLV